MKEGDKVLLIGENNTYLREVNRIQIQFAEGVFEPEDLIGVKYGEKAETHIGEVFLVLEPSLNDIFEHEFRQETQTVNPKDAGAMIAHAGIGKDSVVVEAGTGSGYLTATLANVARRVVTYEERDDFYENARENIEGAGFDNVEMKKRNILEEGFDETNADAVVLDMMGLEEGIPRAREALKPGGFLICYCPVIDQVQDSLEYLDGFEIEKVVENVEREWRVNPSRPKSKQIVHTAFLLFARKFD